jgi:hypothetical protein
MDTPTTPEMQKPPTQGKGHKEKEKEIMTTFRGRKNSGRGVSINELSNGQPATAVARDKGQPPHSLLNISFTREDTSTT